MPREPGGTPAPDESVAALSGSPAVPTPHSEIMRVFGNAASGPIRELLALLDFGGLLSLRGACRHMLAAVCSARVVGPALLREARFASLLRTLGAGSAPARPEWGCELLGQASVEAIRARVGTSGLGAFGVACSRGHLELAQAFWARGLDVQDICDRVIWEVFDLGRVEVARWFHGLGVSRADLFRRGFLAACGGGHLAAVQWAWPQELAATDESARYIVADGFRQACCSGRLAVAQWIWGRGLTLAELELTSAAAADRVRSGGARDGLAEDGDLCAFGNACQWGELAVAQWLWGLGLTLADVRRNGGRVFRDACGAGDGRPEVAQWLWSLGLTLADVRAKGECYGNLDPGGATAFDWACDTDNLVIAQWIWSLGLTLEDVRVDDCLVFNRACGNGCLEMAQWLWSLGLSRDDLTGDGWGFYEACREGHLEVVRWLWSECGAAGFLANPSEEGHRDILAGAMSTRIGPWLADIGWPEEYGPAAGAAAS